MFLRKGKRETYQLTNTTPSLTRSLTWQPQTLVINNTSAYPCYVRVGNTQPPSLASFDDFVPPFTSYVIDPAGSKDFAVLVDNSANPGAAFTYPVLVTFSTGAASAQGPLNSNFSTGYIAKVQAVQAASLIDLWPLNELSGTIAIDKQNAARNGAYVNGPTLAAVLFADGFNKAPTFVPASNQYVNVFTTGVGGLDSVWNNAEFSLLVWFQMTAAHLNDANEYDFLYIGDTTQTIFVRILKPSANLIRVQGSGGVNAQIDSSGFTQTTWTPVVVTFNHALTRMRLYVNGSQVGSDLTTSFLMTGTIQAASIMARQPGFAAKAPDDAAMCAIWTKELTAAEALVVSTAV